MKTGKSSQNKNSSSKREASFEQIFGRKEAQELEHLRERLTLAQLRRTQLETLPKPELALFRAQRTAKISAARRLESQLAEAVAELEKADHGNR